MEPINNRSIKDVAIYTGLSLITKGLTVSPLKLQKMLYYEQSWFMAFGGRQNTLFPDVPEAWVNGPVYHDIYFEYKDRTQNMCDHLKSSDFTEGDPIEALQFYYKRLNLGTEYSELIESVITMYGSKTQNQLIFMTHSERPWAETRNGLPPYERSTRKISLDLMCEYYRQRHERNRNKHED